MQHSLYFFNCRVNTNASALKLAKEIGGSCLVYMIAFLACVAALVTLLIHTYEDNLEAIRVFFSFAEFNYFVNRFVKLNVVPSNKPLSLSLRSGITKSDIKDKVINGALSFEPI
jgi:hypothetical protein